jgi:hypothetical protein
MCLPAKLSILLLRSLKVSRHIEFPSFAPAANSARNVVAVFLDESCHFYECFLSVTMFRLNPGEPASPF